MKNILIAATAALVLVGCKGAPDIALPTPTPWYTPQTDLLLKAEAHELATAAMVNSNGLLLYKPYLPWSDSGPGWENYLLSHDIADAPAWHGWLLMTYALKAAVTGEDYDLRLRHLANGLALYFDVTGIEGLLGRSYLADYTGPRLDWMDTEESRPTKFWQQGPDGRWFRNGVAKGHYNGALVGVGLTLYLARTGKIHLTAETESVLQRVLVSCVRHLHDGDWRVRDHGGEFTEFGDMRPDLTFGPDWPEVSGVPNGFNRMLLLSALCSASHYDADLAQLYETEAINWAPGLGDSMEAVGEAIKKIGHWTYGKPSYSDMQQFGVAAFVLLLQEDRREITKGVHKGMVGLWEYMRYERNPAFTLPYTLVRPQEAAMRLPDIEDTLRSFPMPEDKMGFAFQKKETDTIQPIQNRPPNTMYWKSSPFRLALSVDRTNVNRHPTTNDPQHFMGADYTAVYWMGRYLEVLPER